MVMEYRLARVFRNVTLRQPDRDTYDAEKIIDQFLKEKGIKYKPHNIGLYADKYGRFNEMEKA